MHAEEHIKDARVLIVDDDDENVALLELILSQANYSAVSSVRDPRRAVEYYRNLRPDLILLDINMPHMNGFQVMEELKNFTKANYIPIIILTAEQDFTTRIKALESGAMDFLTKPFHKAEALSRIRNMILGRLLFKQVQNQNVILEQKVEERTKKLRETQLEIVKRLGLAAEYKDNETGLHIIRMSQISKTLGLALGLDEKQADLLLNATAMHDIGKIGIPDSILTKPGKLTATEWETMKTHTTIGAKMLEGNSSELLDLARNVALTHHEKWDGSGYPRGLSGKDIPMAGRICAIADVFDALTSQRPYKKPWSVKDALNFIEQGRGVHFDPEIVDVFMASLDEILKIKEKYAEPAGTSIPAGVELV